MHWFSHFFLCSRKVVWLIAYCCLTQKCSVSQRRTHACRVEGVRGCGRIVNAKAFQFEGRINNARKAMYVRTSLQHPFFNAKRCVDVSSVVSAMHAQRERNDTILNRKRTLVSVNHLGSNTKRTARTMAPSETNV